MPRFNLLVDSGAFSAWFAKSTIDIEAYIAFLKRNSAYICNYVNLDVIPGEGGIMDKSRRALERSAAQSHENLCRMKEAGLHPIPVFHQDEDFKWLELMLDEGEPYIGISPYLRAKPSKIEKWLIDCFHILTDSKGYPLAKTHGFGVTTSRLCSTVPWYSVDSTMWAKASGGYGLLAMPSLQSDGTPWDLSAKFNMQKLHITHREDYRAQQESFDRIGNKTRNAVEAYLNKIGVSSDHARNIMKSRFHISAYYSALLSECCPKKFTPSSRNLFIKKRKQASISWPKMRVFLATAFRSAMHNTCLNDLDHKDRLITYWELKDNDESMLHYYAMHGLCKPYVKHVPKRINFNNEQYKGYRRAALLNKLYGRDEDVYFDEIR